jgi:hypothetical protein
LHIIGDLPHYRYTTEPDGNFILITIPGIDGVTQARTPEEVHHMVRDYIAVTLDIPEDSFTIEAIG